MDFLASTTHLHITTWVIGLILFFLAAAGIVKSKGVHMALRLFYILIIISGGALYYEWAINLRTDATGMGYDMKFMFGILLIGMMEMILVRQKKNKPTTIFWGIICGILIPNIILRIKITSWNGFLLSELNGSEIIFSELFLIGFLGDTY